MRHVRGVLALCLLVNAGSSIADDGQDLVTPPRTLESACSAMAPGMPCEPPDSLGLGSVQLHSGEYVLREDDWHVPGRGFDFIFRRAYFSRAHVSRAVVGFPDEQANVHSELGSHWDHSLNIHLRSEPGPFVTASPCVTAS